MIRVELRRSLRAAVWTEGSQLLGVLPVVEAEVCVWAESGELEHVLEQLRYGPPIDDEDLAAAADT